MPNISEYNPGNIQIRPTEIGVESTAVAGRRLGVYGSQIASSYERTGQEAGRALAAAGDTAVAYTDHQQINAGADHASQMWANLQDNWNQTQAGADPHDPSVAKKWREEVLEPTLEQFSGGFTTQKSQDWANARVNTLRQHFYATTEADMSRNAKVAVEATLRNMHNNYTSALIKDPSGLPAVMDQIEHSTEGVLAANPNIKGPDAAEVRLGAGEKLKEAAVKAAVQGAILNGGNWQKIANDPKYSGYVDAGEIKMFEKAARTYDRMAAADARSARVQQDYLNKQNFNEAANKLEVETIPQNPGDPPVLPKDYWDRVKQIGVMPGVDPARLRQLITNGEHITDKLGKPEPTEGVSHETTVQAINDMRAGKPVDVDALYGTEKLRNSDYTFLKTALQQRATPEGERLDKDRELFFKRYSLMIDPTMGEHGDNLYRAEMDARKQEQDLIKQGKDPHLAYDPNSEYFLGNMLSKWKAPLQAGITPASAAPPERPKGFPNDAQWDAARKYWYVVQDGKKFRVEPTAGQPAWPTIPSSQ